MTPYRGHVSHLVLARPCHSLFHSLSHSQHSQHAILDVRGNMIRGQGITEQDAEIIFQMLLEVANLRDVQEFRRMTIAFSNTRYVVARDDNYVYIVHTNA